MRSPSSTSAAAPACEPTLQASIASDAILEWRLPAAVSGSDRTAVDPLQRPLPFECSEVAADGHFRNAELLRKVRDTHTPSLEEEPCDLLSSLARAH